MPLRPVKQNFATLRDQLIPRSGQCRNALMLRCETARCKVCRCCGETLLAGVACVADSRWEGLGWQGRLALERGKLPASADRTPHPELPVRAA